jgi:hypothetical protein
MATTTLPSHTHGGLTSSNLITGTTTAFTGTSTGTFAVDPAYDSMDEMKDFIKDQVKEIKETLAREADDGPMQDMIDLTRVLIEEIRGLRTDLNVLAHPQVPYPQTYPQPQTQPVYPTIGTSAGAPDWKKLNDHVGDALEYSLPDNLKKYMGDKSGK